MTRLGRAVLKGGAGSFTLNKKSRPPGGSV